MLETATIRYPRARGLSSWMLRAAVVKEAVAGASSAKGGWQVDDGAGPRILCGLHLHCCTPLVEQQVSLLVPRAHGTRTYSKRVMKAIPNE